MNGNVDAHNIVVAQRVLVVLAGRKGAARGAQVQATGRWARGMKDKGWPSVIWLGQALLITGAALSSGTRNGQL